LRRTSRLILLFGIFLAALVFVVIVAGGFIQAPNPNGPQATQATTAATVIALQDIPLGTVITQAMVAQQTLSIAGRDSDALSEPSQAIGKKTYVPIKAGEQVHLSDITSGSQAHLVVPKGMRAWSMYVNEETGVGNLITVGDYVDVIMTEGISVVAKDPTTGAIAPVTGLSNVQTVKMPLLLQDIQVIATINQPAAAKVCPAPPDACPPGAAAAPAAAPGASAAPVLNGTNKLIILAVTPAQAEVLTFARTSGTLDLVLRSPDDQGATATTDGVILKTLIDKYGVLPPTVIITTIR
jgi:Flp pilus assembly protein CpaB